MAIECTAAHGRGASLCPSLVAVLSAMLVSTCYGCGARTPLGHRGFDGYRQFEQQPSQGAVTATFLGTTSVLFEDGETSILSDGFVTRPALLELGRPIVPDETRIRRTMEKLGVRSLDAVFTGHTHYDHALDAPQIARQTGAVLIGSESTSNLGRAVGLPAERIRVVSDGSRLTFGKFELTFVESRHSPDDRYPGDIDAPFEVPAPVSRWRTGKTWSVFVRHVNRTLLVHGSANFKPGALRGRPAEVVFLGIGALGRQPADFVRAYWDEVVRATGASRVIVVHWDDFFRSLDEPLRPMPPPLDSFSDAMSSVLRFGKADAVGVLLPVPLRRADPFAGLVPPQPGSQATRGTAFR
jgi:L-ascorbate metabolism protein UlaG (beta-lactamase superfamily)